MEMTAKFFFFFMLIPIFDVTASKTDLNPLKLSKTIKIVNVCLLTEHFNFSNRVYWELASKGNKFAISPPFSVIHTEYETICLVYTHIFVKTHCIINVNSATY